MLMEPNCSIRGCKHFEGVKNFSEETEGDERNVCAAFPEGIPDDIAYGDNQHLFPQSGDNGIVFEQGEPEDEVESGEDLDGDESE